MFAFFNGDVLSVPLSSSPFVALQYRVMRRGSQRPGQTERHGWLHAIIDGTVNTKTGLPTHKWDCQHADGTVNTQTGLSTHRRDCQHTDGTVSTRRSAGRPQRSRDSIRDPDLLRADPDGRRPPRLSLLAQIHIQRWFHLLFFFPFHLHFGLDRWSAVRDYATARQVPLCSKM